MKFIFILLLLSSCCNSKLKVVDELGIPVKNAYLIQVESITRNIIFRNSKVIPIDDTGEISNCRNTNIYEYFVYKENCVPSYIKKDQKTSILYSNKFKLYESKGYLFLSKDKVYDYSTSEQLEESYKAFGLGNLKNNNFISIDTLNTNNDFYLKLNNIEIKNIPQLLLKTRKKIPTSLSISARKCETIRIKINKNEVFTSEMKEFNSKFKQHILENK